MTGYYREILVISKTSIHNSGLYKCYGTYRNESMHFISKARLFVYGKFWGEDGKKLYYVELAIVIVIPKKNTNFVIYYKFQMNEFFNFT